MQTHTRSATLPRRLALLFALLPVIAAVTLVLGPGGGHPSLGRNGRELFFLDGADRLSVVPIAVNGSTLVPGVPRRLLEAAYYPGFTTRGAYLRGYDVSPDGQRFLMSKGRADAAASQTVLTVIANWQR